MRNFTFSWFKSSKPNFLVLFFLLLSFTASAQFYTKHYIAPAPWQYFSKANEIVIATNSTSTVNIVLSKSDGTLVANLTAIKGTPAVYRFTGLPSAAKPFALNTVLNAAGLIITGDAPVSINLRNVASDALGGDGSDQDIKGNAALTSFGDAGLGIRFRVGYYRDGSLGNFGGFGDQRPIYSIMATVNNTVVKINNAVTATLNAGQSYLFKAPIGTLVESSNPAVMNTSAAIDTPGGCGDSAYNQLPPEAVLGTEYFLERGTGNNTAEQTTVVATKDNTTVTIESYTTTGTLSSTNTINLAQAGNFYTFVNGVSGTNFTASHIVADKRVAVYSGTAQNCEVDISTIAPVSECGGSNFIETAKFRDYNSGTLDYFGYILLRSATDVVTVNGTNIATISGVGARYQVGSTGWYLINFNSVQIGSPNVLSIASNSKLTVSIVQQAGGFSMAGFFSNFAAQPEDPTVAYISGGGCTNSSATLTTPSGFTPYQWYYNGTAITGANSNTYTATKTGSYAVSSTLACGSLTQSKPVTVTLCTDLGVTNTVDNATPCVNSNVEFTVRVSNLGSNNATGVSLNDLLPSGYTYSSSTVSVGAYNSTTGVWSIGDLDPAAVATLKIIATVNATGSYNTTASLPASIPDSNAANNSASVSTTPKAITVALVLTGSTICVSPGGNGTITSSTSVSGVNYQLYNSSNATVQTAKSGTGSALTWTALAAGTGYYVIGTSTSTSCSSTSNTVNVATTANPTALVLTGSTICVSPGGDGTITSSTSVSGVNYQLFNASNTAVQAAKSGTGAALTWSGLTAANGYYVIATNAANCTANSNTVNVSTKANPVTPTLSSVTQPTCSTATGSFTITNYDSNNTYAVTPSAGVTRTGNTVTAPAGSYTLTASANGCTSSSSASAVVNAQPATPAVPTLSSVTQPTCSTATGSFTITNYDSNNTYAVTPSAGVTRTGNTVTAPAGSYTLTASANGCTSSSSASAVVNAQPATPAVPTLSSVTQPTCSTATGSFTITNYDSNNTYAVTPSAGVTRTGNTVTAPSGSYTLTASANGCTSSSSASAVVNAQPATPAVPTLSSVTQPTCSTATGSFTITNYDSNNTYAVTPSAGVTRTGNTVTAPSGSYTLTASANGCTSSSSTSAVVNAQPATPAVPTLSSVTQPTCSTATGSFTITNYDSNNTYTITPSAGVTRTGNTVTAPAGSYTLTASANGCTSSSSASAVVNAQPATPAVPTLSSVTQPTCSTATGSFTITNYDSNNTYAVTPSAGVTRTGNTVTAPAGSYTLTASANGCTSSSSASAVVNAQPATPAVPTLSSVTQPTCSTATGSFTITNYDSNNTYTITPSAGVTHTGNTVTAPAGSYTLTASANGCTSSSSASAVVNAQPATPAVPTLSSVTQPTCSTATGSFTITNYDSNNTYAVTPSAGVTRTGNTVTAPAGSYTLTASANGCTSSSSASAVVNAQPATPAVPTLSSVTQPTCSTATGSFTITNYDSNNTYAVTPSAGVTRTGNTVTAPAGSYTLTASANGCTSSSSASAVVNAQPATPAVPALSSVTQPTCSTFIGSFTITNYDSNNTYAITPSAGVTRTGNTVTAPAGSYTLTASANGCTSGSTNVVVNSILCANTDNSYAQQASGSTIITVGNVTTNDTLNGVAVTSANTDVTPKTTGPLSVDVDGVLTLAANTVSGTYTITYEICETGANPANCKTAVATVEVKNNLVANIDTVSSILASNTSQTLAINVFTNDTKNGTALNSSDVNLTTSVADPKGYLTLNADGTVTLGANAPADTYELTYTICEKFATSNCSSNVVRVTVDTPVIDAVTETTASVNGNAGGTTASLTANDTLNGNPVVIGTNPGNVKLSGISVPSGLTLNADGTVTVAANTPAATYDIEYQICEISNPSNCDAVISKVVVNAAVIDAVTETTASVNGNAGGTTASLTANDTLNGNPVVIGTNPGNVKLSGISVPSGLTLNADGTVTVAANTPAATYDIEYQICEISNPSNCDAVISKVVVNAAVIDAVTETTASVNGNAGGTTASLTANDTLNGNPVVIGTNPGNVKLTAVNVPSGLTLNADGTVTVAANTPAATYDVEYQICEISNPSNCDAVISKVVVNAAVIDAVTETTASVNGNAGGTTASLTANDTLNGNPVVIGTNPGNVKLSGISVPSGLTLNADGTVTVAANTPAATYDIEYQICEISNPSNCDAVISKVVVDAAVIDAVTETTASVNGNAGGTTASLTANDTLNGNPVVIGTNPGNVKLTAVNVPSGLTLNADGTVTVAANTPAATYDVEYQICEISNPSNCDAVISKVVVNAAVIDAVTETTASVNGNAGGTTASLTANDTLNGNPVVIGTNPGNVKLSGISVPSGLTLNADGTVTVAANTPAATYDVEYQICEISNPSNCDAVISKVVVNAAVIDAVTETTASVNGNAGGTTASLTANDTLNGNPVVIGTNPGNVKLTAVNVPSGLTLNADGTVTVAANTPAATYDVEYQICEISNPSNCDAVISKVVVNAAVIDAVTETTASVNGNAGGTTASLTANDTLNGNPVVIGTNPGNVKLSGISVPSGLTLNADGTVTVAANTPAATYDIEYQICEISNPSNCDAVISKVVVDAAVIDAVTETTASVNGNAGGTTASLTANDTLNGNPVVIGTNPGNVKLTAVNVPSGLTLNADGTVTVAANTPAATYDVEYQICEISNPSNCDAVISKVVVGAAVIDAVTETTASVNGNAGGTTASLTVNDTLNGNPVVIGTAAGNVKLTAVNVPSGLTLNADGTVTVAANTPAATYDVEYQICEISNPSNCDAVISKVVVSAAVIDAVAETLTPSIIGSIGGTTASSVISGDTLNGVQAVIGTNQGQVKLTGINIPSGFTLNADGTVTVASNTPSGIYNIEYSICEITNPSNCDTAISKVAVNNGTLVANADVIPSVTGSNAPQTLGTNVFTNDTKNGTALNPSDVTLTVSTPDPSGYLTLNPDGTLTLGANPPSGTYELTYTICEKLNPSNCSSNTVTVTVGTSVIDAVAETLAPSINGSIGGTTAGSVIAGDTLNGAQAVIGTNNGQVKLTGINIPAGFTLNADGTVTVAPNTPSGIYNIEYSICEITNPTNCDTAISKVAVNNGTLVANADVIPSVAGSNAPQTLGTNVFTNDTKNGTALNPSDVTLSTTTPDPTGYLVLNPDGTLTLGANPPAGSYELTYTICEKLNPGNCSSNTVTVIVGTPLIDAVTETTAPVNGNTGGTTAALTANDTLNGNPVIIGTNPGNVKLTGINIPAGLTLNADGTITVAPNTPAGNYSVEYSICQINNPSNCDSVISTVPVTAGTLVANADIIPSVTGSNTPQTLGTNVFTNDTKNGTALNPSDVTLTVSTPDPKGYLTLNPDGTLTLGANPPAGTYELTYTICEKLNPSNCSSNTVTVTVGTSVIDAVAETLTPSINGSIGGTTAASVISGDTLNGVQAVIGTNPGQVKLTGINIPSGFTLNADGTVTVASNTPSGIYNIEYSICEITNPSNCDTAISKVAVNNGTLVANADVIPSVTGSNAPQTLGTNVFTNDTKNGTALNPSDVTLTVSTPDPSGYLTLNPDGTLTLGANPPAGTYELTYTICEKLNPSNCSSNTVTVTVGIPVIDAVAEMLAPSINGSIGGTTTGSVIAGDTLNGAQAVIGTNNGQVKLTGINIPAGFTLNADGTVTVAPNTPSGIYNIEYSICEITNPSNCDTAISKVAVNNGTLVANADVIPSVTGSNAPQTLGTNVFTNDTKNGTALNPSDVTLSTTTPDPTGYLVLNPDGTLTLGANPPAGTYELTYTICEKLNPGNCSSNTVTVIVGTPVIDAVTETTAPVNGNTGGTTTALTANDTLNGNPVIIGTNPGNVKLTGINIPAGLTLNADGTITVAPNTPAGNYSVEYSICQINNPSNCDSVISTVPVTAGTLVANADVIPSVTGSNAPQTLGTNVFTNDTKNGTVLNPSDVTLTVSTPDPKGYLTLNPDGTLTLGANPPAGTYELTYTICEKLNPGNCSSNTVTVTVGTPVIDAVTETTASVNGNTGGTTASLTANDTLNGNPVVIGTAPGNVKLTAVNVPAGLTLNADGTVTVALNTPAGNYSVEYTICEINNPSNCDTVISTVPVSAGTLVANADVIPSVTASNAPQTLGTNVFTNDTKNGTALNPSDVTLTVSTPDPKGYLTLNPDGTLTLGANAPAGTYELTYTICEKLNPSNCSSNTVTVTVGSAVIDAVAETLTPSINGSVGGTTTTSVIAGDTLNGVQAVIGTNNGQVKLTGINIPAGFTLNADGTVTVAPNTPSGIYNIEYSICEITNPSNCDTAISKVAVNNGTLVANADVIPSVKASNAPQTLGTSVFTNDTKNGTALNPSDVTLNTTIADPKGYLTLNPDGTLTLGANAPAGTYELTYTICEKLNPGNCSSNTVTVTVAPPVIDAVAETLAPSISGTTGGTTTSSVIAGDTLNGVQAVIGTSNGQVKLTGINIPAGLTLNADGTVTVAPNTPAGIYDIEYSICEITNPTNCDTAISKVVVNAPAGGTLQAISDVVASAVGINQPQTVINIFDNDLNNGLPLVPADVNLTIVTPDPTGYLTLNPDGTVTLAPNTPRGTYELVYQICEKANPSNCSSASVEVTVEEPTMTITADSYCSNNVPYVTYSVVPDNFTAANLLTIKWIDSANNVVGTLVNQPLSGTILWPGATVDANGNGTDWPGWVLTNGQWVEGADGFENTRPGVRMEFSLNPTEMASVTYPVPSGQCNARPTFTIQANNDSAIAVDPTKGPSTGINVFDNDTLNGVKVNPADVILSTVTPNANLTLNADGTVDVKAGTPSGPYQLTYQICEAANTSNCSQATVNVVVQNSGTPVNPTLPLVLTDDVLVSVDGINGSLEFVNVLDNDLLNGQPINPIDVIITNLSGDSNFEFNADGTVNVKPNTPGKTYDLVYQVCEKANPTNCSTATVHVFVEVPAIAIIKTAVFNDENNNNNADPGETITYKFEVTNTGNVPLKGVTISDPLPGIKVSGDAIDLAVGESNDTNFSAVYKITQTDINNEKVTNQASVKGNSARGVVVEDISDDEGVNGDKPTVTSVKGCEIRVLNAFSPNGDQKNERFYIQGIGCYPDNTVEIYNRWGVLVFEKDGYNNEDRVFKGYSEGRTTMKQSEGLPVGTYFYILKYKDSGSNAHEKSGYLYINK